MMGGRKPQDHSRRKFREKWAGCDLWQRLYKVNGLKYGFVCKGRVFAQPRPHLVSREVVTVGDDGDHLIWQQIMIAFKKTFSSAFLPPLVMNPLLSASSLPNSALISLSPCNTSHLIISHLYFAKRKQKLWVKSTEIFDQIIFESLIGLENESSFCLNLIIT